VNTGTFLRKTPRFSRVNRKAEKIVKTPPIFKGKQKSRKNRENTPVFKENTPIFKGKQKSRKNRENSPVFKVYFKINIFSKILPCFSIGPL
jgi:hypothetical protein